MTKAPIFGEETKNMKKNTVLIIIGAVVIVVVAGVLYLLLKKPAAQQPASNQQISVPEELKKREETIKTVAKLDFGEITSSQEISQKVLPKALQEMILEKVTNLQVKSQQYENNKNGYKIVYVAPLSVDAAVNALSGLASWQVLTKDVVSISGYLEMQNDYYQLKAEEVFIDVQSTAVLIEVVGK